MTDRIDIGNGHEISFYTASGDDVARVGLIAWHHTPEGRPCSGGSVLFDVPQNADFPDRNRWQVISMDPLTLSPSLLCRRCGDHGWIRNGIWESA